MKRSSNGLDDVAGNKTPNGIRPEALGYLVDEFVDDFRYHRNPGALAEPFAMNDSKLDALLASTAEQLCAEMGLECPTWILQVPACLSPWFVAGMESLKAIALVESPLRFRIRKIFVLENFLSRV